MLQKNRSWQMSSQKTKVHNSTREGLGRLGPPSLKTNVGWIMPLGPPRVMSAPHDGERPQRARPPPVFAPDGAVLNRTEPPTPTIVTPDALVADEVHQYTAHMVQASQLTLSWLGERHQWTRQPPRPHGRNARNCLPTRIDRDPHGLKGWAGRAGQATVSGTRTQPAHVCVGGVQKWRPQLMQPPCEASHQKHRICAEERRG